ncbi:MAG: glycoside hydrolase family 2 TIM barrel-domain containing protein [Planctomycetota bacterium]|jgi:beta-galactosidase/beta-glucuronidase
MLAVGFGLIAFVGNTSLAQETELQYLSGKGKDAPVPWEFYCSEGRNSGRWTTIGVPSNWELQGFGAYNYGQDKTKSAEYGKYRRRFELPERWKDRTIYIVFEGVMTDTEVWINGKSAGPVHQGGFYRFKYDITGLVEFGADNLAEVTVHKVSSNASVEAAERKADYWVFGGIYRPVYLQAFPSQFIEHTAIDARADGSIAVDVYVKNAAGGELITGSVLDPRVGGGGTAFTLELARGQRKVTLKGNVTRIKAWTAETPHLYDLMVSLMAGGKAVHTRTERFGFRTFEVRPGKGLFLNGRKIRLKGVNRHCFWPDSGRCLSKQVSYDDVRLIKEMNMNAVRMSHYPPDKHFLEACDELGLYVLDELAGWQKPPYDTEIGKKLVRELVMRDLSHPCILFWDNANEGGWNRQLDDQFALYDPQKRTVLHPWENFNGIDTDHYEGYESVRKKLSGSTLFMPTEFLHGLYDGGHGAGLNDYWNLIQNSPLGAGGFLWALVDEGVVRTDKGGLIDTDGNHAPDGILGPYREKEASFYTIREIFSPVHIGLRDLPEDFSGRIGVENRYGFTDLQDCQFQWKLAKFPKPWEDEDEVEIVAEGSATSPSVKPGSEGTLKLDLPEDWRQAHALYLTAADPTAKDIWTWSWALQKDCATCHQYVDQESKKDAQIDVIESDTNLLVKVDALSLSFDRATGQLARVEKDGAKISLASGPRLVTGASKLTELKHHRDGNDVFIEASYDEGLNAKWKVYPSGWVRLNYRYELEGQFDLMGITFDYPENKMQRMKWVGRGPYRVWKNRTKGGRLGVWSNDYKDHTPGVTWDFPEFRGYYTGWQWVAFETQEGRITLLNGTEDVFLGVYTPKNGPDPRRTELKLPATGISLLHSIPAIGTKFKNADEFGPESQRNTASGKYEGSVCFYFEKNP